MFSNLISHGDLIGQFAWREVVGRYKGTYLGMLWSLLYPLMTLAVYTVVFGVILKAGFGAGSGAPPRIDFALNLFCGLILYDIFSGTLSRAPGLITGNSNYVTKVVFPLEIFPVSVLLANLVNALFCLVILVTAALFLCPGVSFTILLFPVVLVPLCCMSVGLGWFLASVGVFLRDLGHAVAIVLQLLFFVSPIIYPVSAVPQGFQSIMMCNPLSPIMESARAVLLMGKQPQWGALLILTLISLVILQLGYIWFMKSKRAFADVL